MSQQHALLSASSSHKWLHCPPSARLEEQFEDTKSVYAAEGSLAHKIAELKLRKHFTPMGPRKYNSELKALQEDPLYSPEMMEHTDTYLDFIQSICHAYASPPHVAIERRLDYSDYAPEGFGTGDCIIIGGGNLIVADFKYGAGVPVDADHNPQMMLYALGALKAYDLIYPIETVQTAIVQPRLNNLSTFTLSVDELRAWGDSIRPTAQQAFEGKGEFCAGDWCRFCRAKAQCRARNEQYAGVVTALDAFAGAKPPLITNDELGEILAKAQPLIAWINDLEGFALSALLRGEPVAGWKAVEGRSNRQFADVSEAFTRIINAGYDEAMLYERKPITLTAIEKMLGKKQFGDLLGSCIIKPPGKPTLAPESDKRQAMTLSPTAAEAFNEPA